MSMKKYVGSVLIVVLLVSHAMAQDGLECLFSSATALLPPFGPSAVATGDLDADGDVDVVFTTGVEELTLFLNNGDGTFAPQQAIFGGTYNDAIQIADLDNDGDLDLAVATLGSIVIRLNNGDATFQTEFVSVFDADYPEILNQLEVGDFDNDGDVDLATIDTAVNPSVVVLLENDGAAGFTTLRQDFSGDSLACGDLDGDGDLDLTVATSSQLELRLNDGAGNFDSTIVANNLGGTIREITIGELFSNNQAAEIVFTVSNPDMVAVAQLDVAAKNLEVVTSRSSFLRFSSPINPPLLTDINGDGINELVVFDFQTTLLIENTGTALGGEATIDIGITSIGASDLNGDGAPDLAIGGSSGNGNAALFLTRTQATGLVGDVNADGTVNLLDIGPFVSAIVNIGVGSFCPAADINGDGSIDLLDIGPLIDFLNNNSGG